jgi:phage terminase large subunit-like protein
MQTKIRRPSSTARGSSNPPDPATAYALDVEAGRIIAGPHVRAACHRHLDDLEHGRERGLTWRPDEAERVYRYFRTCLPLIPEDSSLDVKMFELEPWQKFVVGSLFGWYGADGFRRFRVAFVETGKGSGKSPVAAGLGLFGTHADGEHRAEVYAAATKKDQAQVLFRDAVAMVRGSPSLARRFTTSGQNPVWNLAHLASDSFFRPISSEDDGQSGPRPHFALIDEVHEHKSDVVVEMMRAGFKGRRQPLMFMITNSGVDRQSVCFRYHDYAIKVSSGELQDDTFFGYVCALDEADDPLTEAIDPDLGYPRCWAKANPSIGITFQVSYLEGQVREAIGMPAKESKVRRLNFCQWVDAVNPWIDGDLWRATEVEEPDQIEELRALLSSSDAVLALDLGEKRDMVAAARVLDTEQGPVAELRFWTPADTLEERERSDRVPYSAWVRAGFLRAVPGRSIDFSFVVRDLTDWLTTSQALAFDQWRIDTFQQELDKAGLDNWIWDPPKTVAGSGIRMVRHGQGHGGGRVELDDQGKPLPRKALWMPGSISALEESVVQQQLRVIKNPVLTFNSASAVIERDAQGNAKWEKRRSTGRIDGIVVLSMAVGLASMEFEAAPVPQIFFVGGR